MASKFNICDLTYIILQAYIDGQVGYSEVKFNTGRLISCFIIIIIHLINKSMLLFDLGIHCEFTGNATSNLQMVSSKSRTKSSHFLLSWLRN